MEIKLSWSKISRKEYCGECQTKPPTLNQNVSVYSPQKLLIAVAVMEFVLCEIMLEFNEFGTENCILYASAAEKLYLILVRSWANKQWNWSQTVSIVQEAMWLV